MAFWGVEVKPKKPFTLSFEDLEGASLHLSQATLGRKRTSKRTIVTCKVGDGPEVFLCSFTPGNVETCSLNLYINEDVVFSVLGSTSVHLVGYYEGENFPEDSEDEEGGHEYSSGDDDILLEGEEDDYDEEDDSSEDEDIAFPVPNSGVKIEEVIDEEPSAVVISGPKNEQGNSERRVVPVQKIDNLTKKIKQQDAKTSSVVKDDGKDIGNGNQEQNLAESKKKNLDNKIYSDKGVADGQDEESEDEDGFAILPKRKLEETDEEQPSKKKQVVGSTEGPSAEPTSMQDNTQTSTGTKKAKKKKKKVKDSLVKQEIGTPNQANGIGETPSKQGDGQLNGEGKVPGGKSTSNSKVGDEGVKTPGKKGTIRKYPNGLEIENVSMGKPDGKSATPGKRVGMLYTGKLKSNGKVFDSNVGRKPFEFRLGVGEVIKGWDIGVNGMRVGDKRKLTIPPAMGYGPKGVSGIPPNSWLVFDVELVHVK